MSLPDAERARKENTIVVRCANGHLPITYYSRRDQPVACPVCGTLPPGPQPKKEDR